MISVIERSKNGERTCSLSRRIAVILLTVLLVSVGMFITIWKPSLESKLNEFGRIESETQLALLGQSLLPFILQNQIAGIHETLNQVLAGSDKWKYLELRGIDGSLLFPLGARSSGAREPIEVSHKIAHRGEPLATLKVGADYSTVQRLVGESFTKVSLAGLCIFMLAALAIASAMEMSVGRRVRQLAQASAKISGGNYEVEIVAGCRDEIGQLAECLTDMQHAVRTKTAALLEAKEKAEAASAAKSQFLATMSHEIRTPMNGVLSSVYLLDDTSLNRDQAVLVDTIGESGRQLLAIINDILDFSRLESGKVELRSEKFAAETLVSTAVSQLGAHAKESGNQLAISKRSLEPDLHLLGDRTRIIQVLTNIIGNAIKFTKGGLITVEVESTVVGADEATVRFEVSDTGIGIPEARVGEIFEKFTQIDSSLSREHEGSGLGLAICQNLVGAMGGEIGCSSVEGKGSSFWFSLTLPRASEPASVRATDAQVCPQDRNHRRQGTSGGTAGIRKESALSEATVSHPQQTRDEMEILLVEDSKVNQMLLKMLLQRIGHRVTIASDGIEGVRLAQSQAFDVVFMDMQMPGIDGIEATRRIRRLPKPAASVPIFAITANVWASDRDLCFAAGMDGYISKPVEPDMLEQALKLAKNHGLRPAVAAEPAASLQGASS